ncbi:MAG: GNAT family N-acetyltransferase [Alphaproteobacteria bacterium]|nr:GNAT family N-acetyltransferase [Alphaproteobacteria bacterium]
MLTVRQYDDGEAFWREVAEPLSSRGVPTNAFVGYAYATRAETPPAIMRLGVFDGARVVVGALQTPPFRLSLADDGADAQATLVLAEHLAARGVGLSGVMGDERLVDSFVGDWCARTGLRFNDPGAHGRRQNLYQVTRVAPPLGVAGHMRPASAGERDLLVQWEQGFATDASLPPLESDPAFVAQLVDVGLADGGFYLWEVDGRPRATARLRRIAHFGARVSGVYTPPPERGHGYAAALTAALSQMVLDRGQFCCLFADAANPLTNRIYQRIGYVRVAGFADILFSDAETCEAAWRASS